MDPELVERFRKRRFAILTKHITSRDGSREIVTMPRILSRKHACGHCGDSRIFVERMAAPGC